MIKYFLLFAVFFLPFSANAASDPCSYFEKEIEASFKSYLRVKNGNDKSPTSFNIVGAGSDALQNLNHQIQIYKNLNCDVQVLKQNMSSAVQKRK